MLGFYLLGYRYFPRVGPLSSVFAGEIHDHMAPRTPSCGKEWPWRSIRNMWRLTYGLHWLHDHHRLLLTMPANIDCGGPEEQGEQGWRRR